MIVRHGLVWSSRSCLGIFCQYDLCTYTYTRTRTRRDSSYIRGLGAPRDIFCIFSMRFVHVHVHTYIYNHFCYYVHCDNSHGSCHDCTSWFGMVLPFLSWYFLPIRFVHVHVHTYTYTARFFIYQRIGGAPGHFLHFFNAICTRTRTHVHLQSFLLLCSLRQFTWFMS